MLSAGGFSQALAQAPHRYQGLVLSVARSSYGDGLNTILLIGAAIALFGMVMAFATIRQRDFHQAPAQVAEAAAVV